MDILSDIRSLRPRAVDGTPPRRAHLPFASAEKSSSHFVKDSISTMLRPRLSFLTGRELREEFARFGEIEQVHLALDANGRSRAFGFVTYRAEEDAARAMSAMNGVELKGRTIKVDGMYRN